jgi:outer membrane protein OmpA-like peptidoglycan-associated protein
MAEKIIVMPDPDGHIGGVEVDDGKTKTLLDSAYASAEIGADGVAHAVPPGPAKSIERSIAALAQTLPISDGDKDNIRDEQDACPDRPGAASSDPFRNGCPALAEKVIVLPDADGHVGGVEVDDGKSKVVLDTAYASSEVAGSGVQAVGTAPPGAMTRASSALALALPPPDRDDDGIVDSADACPTRPGRASPDAARHGCPAAVEQVVVLADENGHVGAVEVDDGTTKVLVDQAYGAAEVGTDGIARGLPVQATEVSAKYGAAMAAQPAGARIILYFNQRAEPVRDLTGPIDNLVAELKSRADYKLEVIGHTDQTGSEKANQKIGLERAQLIADRLVAAGVAKDRITVKSMGSKEPAVKLKSRRVVELRNRRVEIWVK